MKVCSKCGAVVTIEELKFVGVQRSGGMANYDLDLYNHTCGTTLTFKVYNEAKNAAEMAAQTVDVLDNVIKFNYSLKKVA